MSYYCYLGFTCPHCKGFFATDSYEREHVRKCQPWRRELRRGVFKAIPQGKLNLAMALLAAKDVTDTCLEWTYRFTFNTREHAMKADKFHKDNQIPYSWLYDLQDVTCFQDYFKEYQIIVADMDHLELVYFNTEAYQQLLLLYQDQHFDVLFQLKDILDVMEELR